MDYEGFVDSEGFDGGDGQVGVVGDGEVSPLLFIAELARLLCCSPGVHCAPV